MLENLYRQLLIQIGEDPEREGLKDTPNRAANALNYLTRGYHQKLDQVVSGALFKSETNDMVIVRDIEMYSLCEHHLLPFFGKCHIGYIPAGRVLGLSKLARVVDMHSRRLQIQESLTHHIAQDILEVTQADGVGVIIEAFHMCMMMRGVEKQSSAMKTSAMFGNFRTSHATRSEFLSLLNINSQGL